LSDVWQELVERLKQKAKTTNEILAYIHDLQEFVDAGLADGRVLVDKGKEEWVKLEDVEEAIQQIKQKHVIIEKKKLEDFRCFIRKKAEECLREMETEEGIIREGLEARLGVYDEITLKLEELLRK